MRQIEIKITVKGSTQADVEMIQMIKEVLTKVQEADASFLILPYCAGDAGLPATTKVQNIPDNMGQLKKYFQGATPRLYGRSYYIWSLVCFNTPFATIIENIGWWLGANKAGMWMRKVQTERTSRIGFCYTPFA